MASLPPRPLYIRLPKQGTLCPWSNLSRGKLNELILPTAQHPKPPVASFLIPNRSGNKKGCRMIVLQSLLSYLRGLEKAAEAA